MTHLDNELRQLKASIIELMKMTRKQLERSKLAFFTMDKPLAKEIKRFENRINALELTIDRDCENIFALFYPVATDLRFVISMLNMNADLERIADYADGIAHYIMNIERKFSTDILEKTEINEMFDTSISMMDDLIDGFEHQDNDIVRKVFMKDDILNGINAKSARTISDHIEQNPKEAYQLLYLFSSIKKLERVGDHIKNIAEDIIFYTDAEVLKHGNKK